MEGHRSIFPPIVGPALAVLSFAAIFGAPLQAAPSGGEAPRTGVRFSGHKWLVIDDGALRGPGPNIFDGRNVTVDSSGRLVLETAIRGGRWTCAHVLLGTSLGHGIYELEIAPLEKDLDPRAVLGFFTWDEDPRYANREIDVELSRWGSPGAPNLLFTVQPGQDHPERQVSFDLDLTKGASLRFEWRPASVAFSAEAGGVTRSWAFPDPDGGPPLPFAVPPAGKERVGINLWLMDGIGGDSGPDRIVVERFRFTRLRNRRRPPARTERSRREGSQSLRGAPDPQSPTRPFLKA